MIALDGGSVAMDDERDGHPGDAEGPVRELRVAPFRVAACAVSDRRFAAFGFRVASGRCSTVA